MIIIGHRGAAGLAPENTVSSFKKAIESNVDMIETDLRLLNGQIILSHDRTANDTEYMTLSELLEISTVPLNLEIKESGFEQQLLEQIKGFAHKVLITSYNPWVLKKIRTLDTNIQLGPVIGSEYHAFLPIVLWLLKNINIYSVTLGLELVNVKTINKLHKLGVKVFPFTVNELSQLEKLKELGIDGFFTDYPNILSK